MHLMDKIRDPARRIVRGDAAQDRRPQSRTQMRVQHPLGHPQRSLLVIKLPCPTRIYLLSNARAPRSR